MQPGLEFRADEQRRLWFDCMGMKPPPHRRRGGEEEHGATDSGKENIMDGEIDDVERDM